ncbi:WhiB family transcriptional regulator [Actinomadura hibisca]|uniref:WhiB family transcriptional regulator n=1 Tax=Actinomadura hibisca TaxID=68565 RepID=UPI001FE1A439|nr:WhiB family transcriptional regulator [Actinomadura hibisca]
MSRRLSVLDTPPGPLLDVRGAPAAGAQCRFDPELHTGPDAEESPAEREARELVAAEVCRTCPLRLECLAYALATRPEVGVWGGLTAAQIAALPDRPTDELKDVA